MAGCETGGHLRTRKQPARRTLLALLERNVAHICVLYGENATPSCVNRLSRGDRKPEGDPVVRSSVHSKTIDRIVADYLRGEVARALESAWWAAKGLAFATVVERAARAEIRGVRHPHQRRLKARSLERGHAALNAIQTRLERAADFHELWSTVGAAYRPIHGLGELAIYDTAERLRHRLKLESTHVIYLHSGARIGARRLAGGRLKRECAWGIQRVDVPAGLRHLSTHQIEDILCIYKDDLLLPPDQFVERSPGNPGSCGASDDDWPTC